LYCSLTFYGSFDLKHLCRGVRIGGHRDGLSDGANPVGVVLHLDLSGLSGLNGTFGFLGNGTSTAGFHIADHQGSGSDVGKFKYTDAVASLLDFPVIDGLTLELDF